MIRLGCCAFNFGSMDLADAMRRAKGLGFGCVDVSMGQLGGQHAVEARPGRIAGRVRAAAVETGVELSELFVSSPKVDGVTIAPNEPDPHLRSRMLENGRKICAFATQAGFTSVMGGAGCYQPALGGKGSWDLAAETLGELVRIGRDEGIRYHVEPSKESIVGRPEAALRMVQDVPELRYTLDYAYFIAQGIALSDVLPLHEYAGHIHAKQARPGYLKTFAHNGTIDYGAIVDDLVDRDWDGVMVMQCIGYDSGSPDITDVVYREIDLTWHVLPPDAGLVGQPSFQTVALAHDIEQHIRRRYGAAQAAAS